MSRWNKVLYSFAWVTLAVAMTLILTVTFWLVAPYRGLYDVPQPFPMSSSNVEVGQLASYTVKYCVDESLPLPMTVQREMELQGANGAIFPLAPPIEYLIKDRCETRVLSFGVPFYMPLGEYHIHYTTSLKVNPFREVRQTFQSQNFTIVPSTVLERQAQEAAALVRETAKSAAKELSKKK